MRGDGVVVRVPHYVKWVLIFTIVDRGVQCTFADFGQHAQIYYPGRVRRCPLILHLIGLRRRRLHARAEEVVDVPADHPCRPVSLGVRFLNWKTCESHQLRSVRETHRQASNLPPQLATVEGERSVDREGQEFLDLRERPAITKTPSVQRKHRFTAPWRRLRALKLLGFLN